MLDIALITSVCSSFVMYGLIGKLRHWFATFSATGNLLHCAQDFQRQALVEE